MTETPGPNPVRPRAAGVTDIAVLTALAALLAGLGETASYLVFRFGMGQLTGASPQVVWMAPVAYLAFFLPIAVLLVAARRVRPEWVTQRSVTGVFAFLVSFALLLPHGSLAVWATAPLAAGLGIQAGRAVVGREAAWRRTARATVAVLGVGVAATSVVSIAVVARAERRAVAGLSPAVPGAPNVILLVFDTVRRSSLSTYGFALPTSPNLTRLAAEGALFSRALAPAPWTLPSHAAMFSGLVGDTLVTGGWRTPARLPSVVLAEVFGRRGYATAGFTANIAFTSRETGLARGFQHFEDYPVTAGTVLLHSAFARTNLAHRLLQVRSPREVLPAVLGASLRPHMKPSWVAKPAGQVADDFLRWQSGVGDRPFFAFLNFFDAHEPYRAPERYLRVFGAARRSHRYQAAIAYQDAELGRLTDSLRARGLLDRTILVVVADHGEQFGERGLRGHANSLYRPVLAVPLMVRYPAAVPAGRRVPVRVSVRDLPATVADLAGVGGEAFPGTSLTRYWASATPPAADPVFASLAQGINVDPAFRNARAPMQAVYAGDHKYIRHGDGREELYDLAADSAETRNLARHPAARGHLERLRTVLDSVVAGHQRTSGSERAARDRPPYPFRASS